MEKHHRASHLWNGSKFLHEFLILSWVLWILHVKVSTGQEIKKNGNVYHLIWVAGGFKQRTARLVSQQIIWIYYLTYYCHYYEVSSYYACFWTQILWWTIDPQELKCPCDNTVPSCSSCRPKCMLERTWRFIPAFLLVVDPVLFLSFTCFFCMFVVFKCPFFLRLCVFF